MTFFTDAWAWVTQPSQWHGAGGIPQQVLAHLGYSGLSLLAGAWRAIATLGLLILLVVVLGFSFLTWLVPLVVLAIPPILVNAYEGVAAVDPQARQAALGLGMTGWQQVTRVEVRAQHDRQAADRQPRPPRPHHHSAHRTALGF